MFTREVSIIFKNFLPNPDLPICQLFCLFVATLFDSLTDFGAYSYWIGLIISLIVSGALYRWRLTVIMKRFESLAKSKR